MLARLGVAWSGGKVVSIQEGGGLQEGLHGLLDHGRPCWWGDCNRKGFHIAEDVGCMCRAVNLDRQRSHRKALKAIHTR
jgi:hypothetical protein